MKRISIFALLLSLAVSCATAVSAPERLDEFVEKTEKEYANYTPEDWKQSKETFDAIMEELGQNYESMSVSEKAQVAKAVSRYGTLLLQSELSEASVNLGNFLDKIPETVNGIINGIDTASIRQSYEGIVNSLDTARLRRQIEGVAESIDTAGLKEKIQAIRKIFGAE